MADVFDNNVQSLESIETDDARMIVLAGATRFRLDKKTGLLHREFLASPSDLTPGVWTSSEHFSIPSFWATGTELADALESAWRYRLTWFVPSAEVCYPKELSKKRNPYAPSAEDRRHMAMRRASSRRMGSKAIRQKMLKRFVWLLWNFLIDRETLKLCHAYFGRRASLPDYNYTVRRKADLAARLTETPNLAPVVGTFVKSSPKFKTGRYRLPADILKQARADVFPDRVSPDALTPSGWRFLSKQTPTTVAVLWLEATRAATNAPGLALVPLLNLVSKTGAQPPFTLLKRLSTEMRMLRWRMTAEGFAAAEDNLVRFIRLAAHEAVAAKKGGRLIRFVSSDFMLALDWLKQGDVRDHYYHEPVPERTLASVPKNATWASIMRAQQQWHAQRRERERIRREVDAEEQRQYTEARDATTWASALPACEVMGAAVVPLVTGKELREEGDRMDHCVGDYVERCAHGTSRIFSIKHQGEDATLELVEAGKGAWRVRQVFGPENFDVSKQMASIAKSTAKLYEAAARGGSGQAEKLVRR